MAHSPIGECTSDCRRIGCPEEDMKNIQPFTRSYETNWTSDFMHQPDTEAEDSVQAESLAVEREEREELKETNEE